LRIGICERTPQFLGAVALLGIALLGAACIPSGGGSGRSVDPAAFDGLRVEDLEGRVWDQSSFDGQVVLIDFWATWCSPCVHEMPFLKTAWERWHGDGLLILGISLDGPDRSGFRQWLEENGIEWPQIHEGRMFECPTAKRFGVDSIPRSILLDREGQVVATDLRGPRLLQTLERVIGS